MRTVEKGRGGGEWSMRIWIRRGMGRASSVVVEVVRLSLLLSLSLSSMSGGELEGG